MIYNKKKYFLELFKNIKFLNVMIYISLIISFTIQISSRSIILIQSSEKKRICLLVDLRVYSFANRVVVVNERLSFYNLGAVFLYAFNLTIIHWFYIFHFLKL